MKFSKKQLAIIGGCACLGVLIVGGAYYIATTQNAPSFKLEKAKPSQDNDTQTSKSSSSEEVYYDDSTKQAKSTLESNKEVSEKDFNIAKIKIVYALDAIKNSENTEPSYGSFYGITTTQMIESLKQAYSFGYTPDETSLKVYQSNSNNVHQFIIDFLNGDKKVTVTGNLNTDTNQVQFSTVQGSFEGVQQ